MNTEITSLAERVKSLAQYVALYRMGVPPSMERTLECAGIVDELRATYVAIQMEGTDEVLGLARQRVLPDPKNQALAGAFARAAEEVRAAMRITLDGASS